MIRFSQVFLLCAISLTVTFNLIYNLRIDKGFSYITNIKSCITNILLQMGTKLCKNIPACQVNFIITFSFITCIPERKISDLKPAQLGTNHWHWYQIPNKNKTDQISWREGYGTGLKPELMIIYLIRVLACGKMDRYNFEMEYVLLSRIFTTFSYALHQRTYDTIECTW